MRGRPEIDTIIIGGRAILPGADPHQPPECDIVVRNGRIVGTGAPGLPRPDGVRVVDAAGMLVLPGFVNAHYHEFPHPAPGEHPQHERIARFHNELKRRAEAVGIFSDEGAIVRLIGAVLLEANDDWQLENRYMQTEPMAQLTPSTIDAEPTDIATKAA